MPLPLSLPTGGPPRHPPASCSAYVLLRTDRYSAHDAKFLVLKGSAVAPPPELRYAFASLGPIRQIYKRTRWMNCRETVDG